jgi:anti-anti-sigma factor
MAPARYELVGVHASPNPVLELRGEIDATNAADFERELQSAINTEATILDISPVSYFDSAGFAVLDRLLATGTLIVVVSSTSVLRRAASLMGVPFHDTVSQARDALTTSR